ncbi:MAG: hypothetical protein KIT58_01155 [Planctomycetota bacterium]|nr:hypothetical protein [Planctomycetota bacterium]
MPPLRAPAARPELGPSEGKVLEVLAAAFPPTARPSSGAVAAPLAPVDPDDALTAVPWGSSRPTPAPASLGVAARASR